MNFRNPQISLPMVAIPLIKSGSIRTSIDGPRFGLVRHSLQSDLFHQTSWSSFNQYLIENGKELNTKNTFKITELNILISVSVNWILNELQFLSFLPILRVRFSTFFISKTTTYNSIQFKSFIKNQITSISTEIRENTLFWREIKVNKIGKADSFLLVDHRFRLHLFHPTK